MQITKEMPKEQPVLADFVFDWINERDPDIVYEAIREFEKLYPHPDDIIKEQNEEV